MDCQNSIDLSRYDEGLLVAEVKMTKPKISVWGYQGACIYPKKKATVCGKVFPKARIRNISETVDSKSCIIPCSNEHFLHGLAIKIAIAMLLVIETTVGATTGPLLQMSDRSWS